MDDRDELGQTAFLHAMKSGSMRAAVFLFTFGTNASITDNEGRTWRELGAWRPSCSFMS